jgi:hypothetical protein
MYRSRIALLFSLAVVCGAQSAPAQAHSRHRHPSGAKILIGGTLVEPVCQVARQLTGSALARCAEQRGGARASLVLVSSDSALYLVATDAMSDDAVAAARKLIGQQVRVNGTVFRAGNGYVILLDSLWVER